ncbi:MAG: hypothetical protein IT461_05755 [Planctomycetes bacterium]|nr:hypothetical protein [Planctomycetota bacterium]
MATNTSLQNADRLVLTDQWQWLIENFPWKLQIARFWPFTGIHGGFLRVARTNLIDKSDLADFNSSCGQVTLHTDQPDSTVTYGLANLITRYQVCFDDQDKFEIPNNLDETEYVLAQMRLIYRYFRRLGQAAAGTFDFPTLQDVVGTGQTIDMGGVALTFAALDQTYNLVTENEGRPNAIMSNSRALRTYQNLFVATHGILPPTVKVARPDPIKGMVLEEIAAFNGTPWYINDLIDDQASSRGIVFFMVLGDDKGPGHFRGITGIVPKGRERDMFIKRQTAGHTDEVPEAPYLKAITNTWVSWPCGMAMGAQGSLSILKGFNLVADLPTT